jgi:monofunctional biosynthetic peptidoglycan transglycosylase
MRLIRRTLLALAALTVGLPVAIILLYQVFPPPVTPLMLSRPIATDYRWVELDQISPHVVRAVIASEDQLFCEHWGIDWRQMRIVLDELLEDGEPSRGASTISMQTARNLFLPPSKTALRKAVEIPLALALDLITPKDRLITLYLNIAEWGEGIYGIEAAAQRHFGKPAKALSAAEAARLVAVLPNPLARDPARPSAAVQSRANRIAAEVRRSGGLWDCI